MNWLTEQISAVGAWVLNQIVHTGRFGRFSWQVIRKFPASLKRFSIVVQQMMFLGNHSLLIIAVSGFFIGAVLGLQAMTFSSLTAAKRRSAFLSRSR